MNKVIKSLMVICLGNYMNSFGQVDSHFGDLILLDIPYGLQSTMQSIYPGPDGTSYAITSQKPAVATMWTAQNVIANKLSTDFTFLEEHKVEGVKFSPMANNGGLSFITVGEQLHIIHIAKEDDQIKIFQTPIENANQQKEIGHFKTEGKISATFNKLIQSPDNKLYAAILDAGNSDDDYSFIFTFDEKFAALGQYKFKHNANARQRQVAINNAGDLVLFELFDNGAKKKETTYLTFDFHLIKDGKETATYQAKQVEQTNATSALTTDGTNFYADILCDHTVEVTVKNKKEEQDKFSLYHYALGPTLTLLKESKSDISTSKINQIRSVDKLYGNQIEIKGSFAMKDSMMIIVGEASDYSTVTFHHEESHWVANTPTSSNPYPMTTTTTTSTSERPSWRFTGIFVALLDGSGQIKETKVLERAIYGAFVELYLVKPVRVGESVCFTYWEMDDRLTHLVQFDIDENGALAKREKTMDQDVLDGRAIVGETLTTDGKSFLYAKIDHPRKKAKVIRMQVN